MPLYFISGVRSLNSVLSHLLRSHSRGSATNTADFWPVTLKCPGEGQMPAQWENREGVPGHQLNVIYFPASGGEKSSWVFEEGEQTHGYLLFALGFALGLWILEGERKPSHSAEFWNLPMKARAACGVYPMPAQSLPMRCPREALSVRCALTSHRRTLCLLTVVRFPSFFSSSVPTPILPSHRCKEGAVFIHLARKRTRNLKLSLTATLLSLLPWFWKWGISFLTMVWRL